MEQKLANRDVSSNDQKPHNLVDAGHQWTIEQKPPEALHPDQDMGLHETFGDEVTGIEEETHLITRSSKQQEFNKAQTPKLKKHPNEDWNTFSRDTFRTPPNKTAVANSLRLLQFNNIDHCPVILVYNTLPKETIRFNKESGEMAN